MKAREKQQDMGDGMIVREKSEKKTNFVDIFSVRR